MSRTYPPARRLDLVEDYHGTPVADPYRWLEDPGAEESRAWVEAQNRLTFGFLERIPERASLRARLDRLWDFHRFGIPRPAGGRYFFTHNDGLQDHDVVLSLDRIDDEPRLVLDPNGLSPDGSVALADWEVSPDGCFLAYGLTESGSDWQEWRIRDTRSCQDYPERIRWVKFSRTSFTRDAQGFFYSRYDAPDAATMYQEENYFQKLMYHRLGTSQEEDRLVYERKDHRHWGFFAVVSKDGRWLVITVWRGAALRYRILVQDLGEPGSPVRHLVGSFDAAWDFIDNDGPVLWFRTDRDAPRGRIVAVDSRDPEPRGWRELVPEGPDTLTRVTVAGENLVALYLRHARSRVQLFHLDGQPDGELELPGVGSVLGFDGRRDTKETFYSFTGFTCPTTIYRLDLRTRASEVFRAPHIDFDAEGFETHQEFLESRDGTRIPIFLTHRRGLARDGAAPALLTGYGGFGVAVTPSFSPAYLAWLERGGILAVANLRGGGEYGEKWHQAGARNNKRHVFEDFIAAAEWLVAQGWTSPRRLVGLGGSNGGLTVAASMVQRPELFAAALPDVGVYDMLRYHRFTIGWAWVSDYGCADDPAAFPSLAAYSPLHNLRPGTRYPATLITTADHDDRVVPAHSYKFAAALQAAQGDEAPVLIRIDTKAGHGAGKPVRKVRDTMADRLAFALWATRQ